MSASVGLLYDDLFLEHGDPHHPENRARLQAVVAHLKDPDAGALWDRCAHPEFAAATPEQIAWVHDPVYVADLTELCDGGGGYLDGDTFATEETDEAAALAAGAAIAATQQVLLGKLTQAFCLVRPPGHHARRHIGMGFCFFNNIALAAECALRQGHRDRVAIIDWDVHHGNGTQEAFYTRREALYVSLHQSPFYPGTGGLDEIGAEAGLGTTINLPLPMGTGADLYERAFDETIIPMLDLYEPELILVSAGYDAHYADTLGRMLLTHAGFYRMTRRLMDAAERHCRGRMVFALEGGYNLDALGGGVAATLGALLGDDEPGAEEIPYEVHPEIITRAERHLGSVLQAHARTLDRVPEPSVG